MTIKRDILGTIVNIELTDEEIAQAHISYLKDEIAKASGTKVMVKEPVLECMPYEPETNYASKLRECGDKLRHIDKADSRARARILDVYEAFIYEAREDGMLWDEITALTGVCQHALGSRVKRIKYFKRHAA